MAGRGLLKYTLPGSRGVLSTPQLPGTKQVVKGFMDSWIELELRKHYVDNRSIWGDPRPVEKGWTPSSLGEPNDRMLVAAQLGFRGDPIPEKLRRIFDAGNDIEARWLKRFKDLGVWVSDADWLPDAKPGELVLRGRIDIIVRHAFERDRKYIVEVKSINPNGFSNLPRPSRDPAENFQALMNVKGDVGARLHKYMHQLQAYLARMGIPEGILLFDNKGTQDFHDFYIVLEPGFIDPVFERLQRLQDDYWSKGLLPPWGGGSRSKAILATYRPTEAVPYEEVKELYAIRADF